MSKGLHSIFPICANIKPEAKTPRLTRSSWLNCALRDDEAVYWVRIGPYEALAVGNWLYWVSRGHRCLYILHKVEIWKGVTHAWRTDSLTTLKGSATQLLKKYKSSRNAILISYENMFKEVDNWWCSLDRGRAQCTDNIQKMFGKI